MGRNTAAKRLATEADMVALLRKRYCKDSGNGPSAVLIPQVRNAAGFGATRTADALVMGLWPSRGLHLEGFEVKCSRSDLLSELRAPEKAEAIAQYCDRWWLVLADENDIQPGELPAAWGLLARRGQRLFEITPAPVREVPAELPKTFLAAMLRRFDEGQRRPVEQAERDGHAKGYKEGVAAGEANVDLARQDLARLRERVGVFEEATGLSIDVHEKWLVEQASLVRALGSGRTRWDGLMPIVNRMRAAGNDLEKLLAEAGLIDLPDA